MVNNEIKEELQQVIHDFMKKHHIGVGSSSFAMALREIAESVDD